MNSHSVLIIGIGNAYRSDDAAGLRVAEEIRKESTDCAKVILQNSDGAVLMDLWKCTDAVILIDAVCSGGKPGTIYRYDARKQPMPSRFFHYSTHAFGVAEAVELARALNQLPEYFIVYGIEGKCFKAGVRLSPEVEMAAQEVVIQIQRDIHDILLRKYTGCQ